MALARLTRWRKALSKTSTVGDDVESLLAAAVAHQIQRIGPLFGPVEVEGPLHERVDALVLRREQLFDTEQGLDADTARGVVAYTITRLLQG